MRFRAPHLTHLTLWLRRCRALSILALLLGVLPARGDLAFTLLPSVRSGVGTNEVAFAGLLTNRNTTGNFFLNSIVLSFNGAAANYLGADTNVFFGNVPGILLPGESYNDVAFAISLKPATPPAIYSGTVTIRGGSDIFAASDLASQPFQVSLLLTLSIARSGTNEVLLWPAGNFSLQQCTNLRTANWSAVTNAPTIENGQNKLVLPPANSWRFFRLKVL